MFKWFALLGVLTTSVSYALPPEGFENFAVVNGGKLESFFELGFLHQSPAWRNDFQSADMIAGIKTPNNLLTFGGKSMVSPYSGERSAFFGRYDWTFAKTNSFALKYIHEAWSYIASAKETWSADFNFFAPLGSGSAGYYITFGYYYRWLKQRWNSDWGNPLNYDTRDQESWFQGVSGFKIPMSKDNFVSFDINWRDNFSYYNFDNMAFDLGFYFPSQSSLLKVHGGLRSSALTMGSGFVSEYYAGLAIQYY